MLMGSLENVEFDSKAYMAGLYRKMLESDFLVINMESF